MKKERGILFSTPMVKSILDGRKTMTRRKVDVDPGSIIFKTKIVPFTFIEPDQQDEDLENVMVIAFAESPYGNVGDILWVRETHYVGETCIIYKADYTFTPKWKWVPSRFMPKKAARIWLEITDVKVEKLQDITEKDAKYEGVELQFPSHLYKNYNKGTEPKEGFSRATSSFESLWRFINGNESWASNPWVWVIGFKVLSTTGRPEALNQPTR